MLFCGLSKVFSTENQRQFESIGAFWDFMSEQFGRENLRGLGWNWTENTITYVIGLKEGYLTSDVFYPDAEYRQILLPDQGWIHFTGRTESLSQLYEEIYADGVLKYEIEQFYENGDCEVYVIHA